jgi:SAM-dependent methyltransferase
VTVDPRAATGFASGSVDAYERGRPTYPEDALDHLVAEFGLTNGATVLDLAAGTGKLTRSLVPRFGRVIAVEPSPAMRAELQIQVPAAESRNGTAEALPLKDASVDAVFVAQAFHWFRPEQALDEVARVLNPGGGLAMLWNRARWEDAGLPWLEQFRTLVEPPRRAAGPFPAGDEHWKEVLAADHRFTPRRDALFHHVRQIGIEDFIALVASWSWIANLPDRERSNVLDQTRELAGAGAVLELPYQTEVYSCRTLRTR